MSDHTAQMTGLGAGYGNALLRAHERIAELEAENKRLREALEWALAEIRSATRYDNEQQFWNAYDAARQALAEPAWQPPVDPDLIEARECAALADHADRMTDEMSVRVDGIGWIKITWETPVPLAHADAAIAVALSPTAIPDELDRLNALINTTAQHWLDLQSRHTIQWEGAIDGAMKAACGEIDRLRAAEAKLSAQLLECLKQIATMQVDLSEERHAHNKTQFDLAEARKEKALIVAWLRFELYDWPDYVAPADIADALERGEHKDKSDG